MRPSHVFAAGAMLSASLLCRADRIVAYNVSALLAGYDTLKGTIAINYDSPLTTTASLSFQARTAAYQEPYTASWLGTPKSADYEFNGVLIPEFYFVNSDGDILDLVLSQKPLATYVGGPICGDDPTPTQTCLGSSSEIIFPYQPYDLVIRFASGTATPATISTAPEPSSFALLGTGLLGVVGVIRKRFAKH